MNRIRILFITFVFSISVWSCHCTNCSKQESNPDIPDSIFSSGDELIITQTGKDFFDQYVFRNYTESQKVSDFYELRYSISNPEKEFVHGKILFYLDSSGVHMPKYETVGIPNCISNPESCDFNITKEEAVEIAKKENLKEGIKPWLISFRWSPENKMYTWHIISTTYELEGESIQKAEGEEIIISPSNGDILKFGEWKIF